jgi:hypothetical protein
MLHHQKILPRVSLADGLRASLAVLVAVAGCFLVGFRGPRAAGAAEPAAAATNESAPFNLDFVPNDAQLVLALRPAELAAIKVLEPVRLAFGEMGLFEHLELPLEEIEEFKLAAVGDFRVAPQGRPPWPVVVLRAKKPFAWNKLATNVVPEATETIGAGQSYFEQAKARPGGLSAYWFPDDYTIVLAPKEHVTDTFSLRGPLNAPAWAEKWNANAKGPAALMVGINAISFMLESAERRGEVGADISGDADVLLLTGAEADGAFRISGLLECRSPQAAAKINTRVQAALKEFQEQIANNAPPSDAGGAMMLRMFTELIDATKIEAQGATLRSVTTLSDRIGREFKQAVGPARAAALRGQSVNRLKQIALALHNYHDVHKHFPSAVVMGSDGKTPHSWRVEILQFMEQEDLKNVHKQYRMNEPWDSEHNKKLIESTDFFSVPGETGRKNCGYFFATGPGTAFDPVDQPTAIRNITDGTSKTIAIVEAKRSIPWTKPEDIKFDPDEPLPELGGFFEGGYNTAFFDGSVHFIPEDVDEETLRGLLSSRGGEILDLDQLNRPPKANE